MSERTQAPIRLLWTAGGLTAFALGAVGSVVPLLPTVPFMLLAAYCFARGSERFHNWIMTHPTFGPAIKHWQEHGAIARRGKIAATITVLCTFGISVALGLRPLILGIQAGVLGCVMLFILTRPDGPKEPD